MAGSIVAGSEDDFFGQFVMNLKPWWNDRSSWRTGWYRLFKGCLYLTLWAGLYFHTPNNLPFAVLVPCIGLPMRRVVINAARLPSTALSPDVSRDDSLNRAGLIMLNWWFSKISYAHVVIATAAVWAAQIIIQSQAVPLAKLGVLFLLALGVVVVGRFDWYRYLSSLPYKARLAWAESKRDTFICFALLIAAYVFWHAQGIPLISMLYTETTNYIALFLASGAAVIAIITIFAAIWRIFRVEPQPEPNPLDVVGNQNRARDADFAQAAAADEALRGWNDTPSPKFDD